MPVTARLSPTSLWSGSIAWTPHELNFARFDAKLEQRLAEFGADLRVDMERRFAQVDARFEILEARLIQRLETRIGDVKQEMLRWMLASWSTMMLVLLGTLFAVLKAR